MIAARMRLGFALAVLMLVPAVVHARVEKPHAFGAGQLIIDSSTTGAEVFVDGELVGKVPLGGPVYLSPGEHTIKVVKPGFAPMIDVFTIGRKKPTKLDVELVPVTAVLKVTSTVEKARVFVDGKFVGEAPLTAELDVGPRAIQVSKGGYRDFFQNVSAVAGQTVALDVRLEELPEGLNPYKPKGPPPKRWYEKWWVWTIVGVVAVGAATGIGVGVTQAQRDPFAGYDVKGTANPPNLTTR
jgi:hypothetical protein